LRAEQLIETVVFPARQATDDDDILVQLIASTASATPGRRQSRSLELELRM
jgi:hypothetical protein